MKRVHLCLGLLTLVSAGSAMLSGFVVARMVRRRTLENTCRKLVQRL